MLRALWSKRCSLWVELCAARKPKQHARQRGLSRDSSHGSLVTASAAWREERSACSICDDRIKTIPTNGSCVRGRVRVRACRAHAAVVTRIRMSLSSSAVLPVCTLLHAIVFRCSFTREQFHRNFMLRCRLQSRDVATALVGSAGTAACEDEGKAACMHLALTESVAKRQSFGIACRVFIWHSLASHAAEGSMPPTSTFKTRRTLQRPLRMRVAVQVAQTFNVAASAHLHFVIGRINSFQTLCR